MENINGQGAFPLLAVTSNFLDVSKSRCNDGSGENQYIRQEDIDIDEIDKELRSLIYEGMQGMDNIVRNLMTPQAKCIDTVTVVANYARIRLGRIVVRLHEVLRKGFEEYCKEHIYGTICSRSTAWKCKKYSSIPGVTKHMHHHYEKILVLGGLLQYAPFKALDENDPIGAILDDLDPDFMDNFAIMETQTVKNALVIKRTFMVNSLPISYEEAEKLVKFGYTADTASNALSAVKQLMAEGCNQHQAIEKLITQEASCCQKEKVDAAGEQQVHKQDTLEDEVLKLAGKLEKEALEPGPKSVSAHAIETLAVALEKLRSYSDFELRINDGIGGAA